MTNIIRGTSGNDSLTGTPGSDEILTYAGEDTVYAGDGDDYINSNETTLWKNSGRLVAYGGSGNDKINATDDGDDQLFGEGGDDTLYGRGGDDTLDGGDGADYLSGGEGGDTLDGGEGDDRLYGGEGNDTLDGGEGNDYLYDHSGNDTLYGRAGDDVIRTSGSNALVYGGDGNDLINTTATSYYLTNGTLIAYGEEGDDRIKGGSGGSNKLYGGVGDDTLYGGDGNDTLNGGTGYDILSGGDGDDTLDGGEGDDTLYGGNGNDTLNGGTGYDILSGGDGDDTLDGGEGDDTLYGGDGSDTLNGGTGYDILSGGGGDDTYIINSRTFDLYDSGGNDTAIVNVDFARVPSSIENVTYADGVQALPYWINALLYDYAASFSSLLGAAKTFNYSFAENFPTYRDDEEKNGISFEKLSTNSMKNIVKGFDYLSEISNLKFVEVENLDQKNTMAIWVADMSTGTGAAGTANPPSRSLKGSDFWFDVSQKNVVSGNYSAFVLMHELGHAIGLQHAFDNDLLGSTEDTFDWTVMTQTGRTAPYFFEYKPLDIAALQYLYGVNPATRAGDDTYSYTSTGANFIWDGAGTDTIDASSSTEKVTIYLEPGYWGYGGNAKADTITSAGQITVNFGTVIEKLIGSDYADTLTGNDANNEISGGYGDDTIYGGAGNDRLDSSLTFGNDVLFGGLGNDSYSVYSYSGTDTFIEYFNEGIDRVDTAISYSIENVPNIENLYAFAGVEQGIDLTGNSLNNYLASSDGNCILDGGLGSDTAWYGWDYAYDDCSIYIENGDLKVRKGNGSIDILKNFEYVRFSDKTINLSTASIPSLDSTYSVSAVSSAYDEGQTAQFSLVTTDVVAGTYVAYTLSGVSASDLVSNSLTGTAAVSASGTAIISLPLAADALTEGTETITITLDDSPDTTASLTVIDTSISSSYKLSAVYDLRDEGSTAYFSLVASGIDAGTVVAYTISGVSASDLVSGSLNETITTAAAGEIKLISIPIRKDNLTEGAETLTITLDDSSSTTASLVVNDTSKGTTYSITSGAESYDEGQSALFSLVTTNLVAGTSVAYTLSDVSASDLASNSLTGTASVSASGTTIISLPLAADALTEGAETLTITLDDSSSTTASLVVNDTSKAPVVEVTEYRTTILGDKNIVGPEPILIRGLTENITKTNGVITEQFFQYAGARYDYSDIDSVITVITRNGEFTEEFSQEISDYASSLANTTYSDVVKIVGSSSIDAWLITVAGDDGNYIG